MKRGIRPHGYTLLEVMIVLAVTTALLVSAALLFNGRIQRARFTQSVREFDTTIRDTFNEVASGYYPQSIQRCTVTGSAAPSFAAGGGDQGTNTACVAIGKMIQFGLNKTGCTSSSTANCDQIRIYTVVGRRLTPTGNQVSTFQESRAVADVQVQTANTITLGYGLSVTRFFTPSTNTNYGSVGVFSSLAAYDGATSDLISGAQRLIVKPIPGTSLGQTQANARDALAAATSSASLDNAPQTELIVCLRGGNSGRAAIRINAAGRQAATDVLFDSDVPTGCPA